MAVKSYMRVYDFIQLKQYHARRATTEHTSEHVMKILIECALLNCLAWLDLFLQPLRKGEESRRFARRRAVILRRLLSRSEPSPLLGVHPVHPGRWGDRVASAVDPKSSRASVTSTGEGERRTRVSGSSTSSGSGAGALLESAVV